MWLRISLLAMLLSAGAARGETDGILALGRRVLADNQCNGACHQSHAEDNDPLGLYTRANRKVNDRAALHRQVEHCVSRLGSMIFPEEIDAVAAALDVDYYKLK
ncbi:hypothetical protein [uncultured Rhodoblastus sp.]|uniref:hypothetical protein n=1 Tax=uncultured Rhodoblastus sp. TaxID=543037 RepID=UPI0025FFB59C|nr:hypothetical protein [uncultured Rhodoblastus sp.]